MTDYRDKDVEALAKAGRDYGEALHATAVDHPSHYQHGGRETIEIIKDMTADLTSGYEAFLVGTIVKYLSRYPYKGKPVEDLRKADWYLSKLIKEAEK